MTYINDDHNSIAVIGLAGRFPQAGSVDEFWENLTAGVESIRAADDARLRRAGVAEEVLSDPNFVRRTGWLDRVEEFDAAFFGMPPAEAELTDPQHRLLLECAYEAIESAGYDPFGLKVPVGVYAGVGISEYLLAAVAWNPALIGSKDAMSVLIGNDKSYACTRIAHKLNLTGPSVAIDTACSSSLVAINEACKALLLNECDMALAGAARVTVPHGCGYWYQPGGVISPDGHCRPLDAAAAGTVPGNGAGVVLLKRLVDAVEDGDVIRAVIRGGAVNNDGNRKIGFAAPGLSGQARVLSQALLIANVAPDTVEYVELHGTGTHLGDPIEFQALTQAYGTSPGAPRCALGSVKANIGHLDIAAGTAGFIKTVLAVEHGVIPPNIHYSKPHTEIDFDASRFHVNTSLQQWPAREHRRRAGVSSFGIGGTNAHMIVEQPPARELRSGVEDGPHVICLSARSGAALQAKIRQMADFVRERDLPMSAVAYTLAFGRPSFECRAAVVAANRDELLSALGECDESAAARGNQAITSAPQTVAFLFTGQGSQYSGMGEALYARFPVFRNAIDEIERLMVPHLPCGLKELLWREQWKSHLEQTRYTQPALFAFEFGLATLWSSFGIKPSYVIGHSLGEVAAACFAGMFSLADGVEMVCARARLMHESGGAGAMLAICADQQKVRGLLAAAGGRVEIAALNGPRNVVVSGPKADIDMLAKELSALTIGCAPLPAQHAFHSRAFDAASDALRDALRHVQFRTPTIPLVSNLGPLTAPSLQCTPEYWAKQMRETVNFRDGIDFLHQRNVTAYVEVGPASTLAKLGRTCLQGKGQWLYGVEHGCDAVRTLLASVAKLYEIGADIDWQAVRNDTTPHRVCLPTYPFQRTRHWILPDDALRDAAHSRSSASAEPVIAAPESGASPVTMQQEAAVLSAMESRVAAIWNELLSIGALARDADFFALGGNSLMIVQMHEKIRAQLEMDPPLNTLMENPTLAQFAAALEHLAAKRSKREVSRLQPDLANRYEPFPLVEIQQAYAVGRTASFDFGGHSTHLYFEIKPRHYDRERFSQALNKLIARHDMLRAVLCGDHQQRILPDVGVYEVRYYDFTSNPSGAAAHLERLRSEMSHQVLAADRWPLYDIRVSRMSDAEVIIHFSLDMLMLDATSNRIFFRDLELLYQGRDELLPPLSVSYRDYVMARVAAKGSEEYAKAKQYWTSRIPDLPLAPDLPVLTDGAVRGPAGFRRWQKVFDRRTTSRLKQRAKGMAVTPSVLFLTAYGQVLAAWSHRSAFTIDVSISDRVAMHENVNAMLGEFTMVELLAMDFGEACSFKERARRIQRQLWSDYEHKEFNGVEVLRELSKFHGGDRQALMPVVFTSILPVEDSNEAAGLTSQVFETDPDMFSISQTPQVWIDHFAAEEDGQYMLSWDCLEGMFPRGMLDDMFQAYTELVTQLAGEDEAWNEPLRELLPANRSMLRKLTNHRQDAPPGRDTLTTLFAARAAARPDAMALIQSGTTLTYGALLAASQLWAMRLTEQGVLPGDLVALVMRTGWEQVVATLAIHSAGAACAPVPLNAPPERRSEMLKHLAPRCIMTQPGVTSIGNAAHTPVLMVSKLAAPSEPARFPGRADPQLLAYVIHTADSSHEAKAVALTHEAVVNTILAVNERVAIRETDRVIAASSPNSDSSIYEIFGPLAAGATIVMPEGFILAEPVKLDALIAAESVTILHAASEFVSRWLHALAAASRPVAQSVRAVVMSGHRISADLPARIRARAAHEIELICLGGSVEAAIWSGCCVVGEANPRWHRIPYGTPLRNQTLHVLRADLTPSPDGVRGELCIGGASLARGYWNDEESTRRRFIVHPHSGERLFRTGVSARYIEDETIELLDPEDQRITVNGFVLDRSVIERMLAEDEQVGDAFVAHRPKADGGKQLVAYLVSNTSGASTKTRSALGERSRRIATARLPAFMQPHQYIVLDALPLTEQGEVDIAALPLPKSVRPIPAHRRGARSPVERCVVEILEDLLQAKGIDLQDTFFVLGGHSLIAARFVTRVAEALGAEISIRTVFDNPVIADLARAVGESRKAAKPLPPLPEVSDAEPVVLSYAQQRLWFVHQLQQGSPGYAAAYNLPIIWRMRGDLDPTRLRHALQRLLDRHDVLRTALTSVAGKPHATVHREIELPWTFVNLDGLADAESVYQAGVERILNTEFDLARAPLMTASLFRWQAGEHSLVLNMHHIVTDLWSEGIISREIGALYEEGMQTSSLPDVPAVQYAQYARWQKQVWDRGLMQRHESYWLAQLQSLPAALDLVRAQPMNGAVSYSAGAIPFEIASHDASRLKAYAAAHDMTPFAVLLAAFKVLLHFYSGESDIIVGTDTASRAPRETERIIGYFINQVAIRARVDATTSVRGFLATVRAAVAEAFEHQAMPFDRLLEKLKVARLSDSAPVFQVKLNYHSAIEAEPVLRELQVEPENVPRQSVHYDLVLTFTEREGLFGTLQYKDQRFSRPAMQELVDTYRHVLTQMLEADNRRISDLDHAVLADRSVKAAVATAAKLPPCLTLDGRFATAAREHAHKIALNDEEGVLTYQELDAVSNRVAHALRGRGVVAGDYVALCLERKRYQVIAILAVLKAGAAYAPLESRWPDERIRLILRGVRPRLLVADTAVAAQAGSASEVTSVGWEELLRETRNDATNVGHSTDYPAYVIHTSGTTGVPKGVVITHHNVGRLFDSTREYYRFDEKDVWCLFHSYVFDVSVWEMWGALLHGGRLAMVPHQIACTPRDMLELIGREGVTVLNQTPSAFRNLGKALQAAEGQRPAVATLKWIICAGEKLEPSALATWYEACGSGGAQIVNMYGITETTVHTTLHPVQRSEATGNASLIGGPLADLEVFILDDSFRPVPPGTIGEIYVGGEGVATGYLNKPAVTAERMVPNPFSGSSSRLYRSGDLARWTEPGKMDYIGRRDNQIKVRGYRIELEEVETCLRAHPLVAQGIARADKDGNGDTVIAAYWKTAVSGDLTAREISAWLLERLPEYMVPSRYHEVAYFDLTVNGKIDRTRLHVLEAGDDRRSEIVAETLTPTQASLLALVAEIIGVKEITLADNFFQIGGHSLLATQVHAGIGEIFEVNVPLKAVLDTECFADLADIIEMELTSKLARQLLVQERTSDKLEDRVF